MAESKPTRTERKTRFISLRWRLILPLAVVVLVIAMSGAYVIAGSVAGGTAISQENVLLRSAQAVSERSADLYARDRSEAQRAAFTVDVPEAVRSGDVVTLEPILRSLLRVAEMDALIVTDTQGTEVLGVQRIDTGDGVDYALSVDTALGTETIVRAVLDENFAGATGILQTPQGLMLFTGVPISEEGTAVGVALVGRRLDVVLDELQASAYADLTFYGPAGSLLETTLSDPTGLVLPEEVFRQAIRAEGLLPVLELEIDGVPYEAAYQPFNFGPNTLGVTGTLMRDNIPFATEIGRQLVSALAAAVAAGVVIVGFIGATRVATRAEQVSSVAMALATGTRTARTHMRGSDEIGVAGAALDHYASVVQERESRMRQQMRQRRRELAHLLAVLESLPDGVVVQDLQGRVMMMNDTARELLGSQRVFRSTGLHELSAVVSNALGPAIAPGLYTLGEPHRVDLDNRFLSAQAAAVLANAGHRLGTVIVLRDISTEVRRERERDILLDHLAQEIQGPLADLSRTASGSDMLRGFARKVTRSAVALQKMIVDMRELAYADPGAVQRAQRPVHLDTLVWGIANEWRQVARAAGMKFHVSVAHRGLFVLGDERRLRWAVGNIIDNAIKYNTRGGTLTLEVKETGDGSVTLRVRDNGAGINSEDLANVFTRFYRGTPLTHDGEQIRVPGMGQGLYIARQIIEAHGGRIQVKSRLNKGTAVYFSLPLTSGAHLDLPSLPYEGDIEGETVRLPEDFLIEID